MEQLMALLAQQNSERQNNQAPQQQQQAFAQPQLQNLSDQQVSSLLPELLRQMQQPQPPLLRQLQQQTGGLQAPTAAAAALPNDSSNIASQPSLMSAARRLLETRDATQQPSLGCPQQLQLSNTNMGGEPSLTEILELFRRSGAGGAMSVIPPPARAPVAVSSGNSTLSPSMMAALQQLAGNTQGTAQAPVQVQPPVLQASRPAPQQRDNTQDLLSNLIINALGSNNGELQNATIATLLSELSGGLQHSNTERTTAGTSTAALPVAAGGANSNQSSSMSEISDFVRMHLQQQGQQQQQQQAQPTVQRPPPQQQPPPSMAVQSMAVQQQNPAPSPVMASALHENPDRASYPLDDITNPGQHDVLFGRGSGASNHLGNIRYRMLITQYKPRYNAASRVDKPKVADEIVHIWRNLSPPGRFLERCDTEEIEEDDDYTTGRWKDVGDKRAKTKTCQCLREKERQPRNVRGTKN